MNLLYVYINDKNVGILKATEDGKFEFQYTKEANVPISMSLPLREKAFDYKECHGFFNGLLPENEETRKRIGKKYGINPDSDFALLKAIGYDCPGAISFHEEQNSQNLQEFYDLKGEEISDDELEKFINEIPQKPLGTGATDLRLSLAGAQDKTAVLLIDNKIYMPSRYTPTTHIIKPAIKKLKESVENEYICLKTAQLFGLEVPNCEIRQIGKTKFFLIERYDRIIKDNKIKRIHQEDFCQALNIASTYKYENDGGVSFKNAFDILKNTTKPAFAINQFVDYMIFNYLMLNNDAHGKNFSILYNEKGESKLAPIYDVLCTRAYSKLTRRMAMQIGGCYSDMEVLPNNFELFTSEVGINYPNFKKKLLENCEKLPEVLEKVSNSFENKIGMRITENVKKNCLKTLKRFKKLS